MLTVPMTGGGYVPSNLVATCDHSLVTDPNTEVHLSWKAPPIPADHYMIETISMMGKKIVTALHGRESCVLKELTSGGIYYFKVSVVHTCDGQKKRSGGTSSNHITTMKSTLELKVFFLQFEFYNENFSRA